MATDAILELFEELFEWMVLNQVFQMQIIYRMMLSSTLRIVAMVNW